ncbi:MAG: hypothetical protein AAFZ15_09870 [Bacteroidota bacterium]
MKKLTFILFVFSFHINLPGQDSLLVEKLKSNVHFFQSKNNIPSGDGFDFLKEEAANSSFFLIGEDHGLREIPFFTGAFFNAVSPMGYQYFATETGPFTAEMIQSMAADENWEEVFGKHFKKYPLSIPFYYWQEETAMLRSIVKNGGGSPEMIWGLDQEFAASFRMYFKKLENEAQTEEARSIAQEYYEVAEKTFHESLAAKDPSKSLLAVIRPDDFKKMKAAFSGQPAALELISELEQSIEIYQLWFTGGGYESNCLRAEMMKRHFNKYYQAAKKRGERPRVLFKFGANHIYRGPNGLNVFDIGNYISELASQEETASFHMYVIGRKGTQNTWNPFSQREEDKRAVYDPADYLDKIDFGPALRASSETDWAVIDLRPLRKLLFNKRLKNLHKGMEKLIWSYDALLVIPEVHAATSFDW